MTPPTDIITAVVCAVFASTGFWALISSRMDKRDGQRQMLKGLGHDRIVYLGVAYIKRGYITRDEYENLVDYLYKPYKELGGNGTAERIIEEVKHLPMHDKEPKD